MDREREFDHRHHSSLGFGKFREFLNQRNQSEPLSAAMPRFLCLLLCLLSATNLSSCLSSNSKTNRKQEAMLASPGSASLKQNGVVSLLREADSAERNGDRSQVTASSSADTEAGKRKLDKPGKDDLDTYTVEGVGPLSAEGSKVGEILTDVVENLASLRDVVNSLRYQNHVMYRQMKKMQTKFCSSSSVRTQKGMLNEHPSTPPEHHQSVQQDGRYNSREENHLNAPGPVSAALRVEKGSRTEAGSIIGRGPAVVREESGGVCPVQFSYSGETERCYRLSGDRMTWKMARERCRWMKGTLASVDSAREQRVINDMARSNPATQHCDFWIGLTRQGPMSSDDWFWDGDGHLPSYSNWNEHEPNNGNGEEHCTQMLWVFNWKWNDAPCNHGNACFVCETRPKVTTGQ